MSGQANRENIFNLISKEMFVDHPYPQKRSVTGWFPKIHFHGKDDG
jgi:hypothetical protein